MIEKFRMRVDSQLEPAAPAGTIVRAYSGPTYGLDRDDTEATGVQHRAVTLDPKGGEPFFTVPVGDLDPVDKPLPRREWKARSPGRSLGRTEVVNLPVSSPKGQKRIRLKMMPDGKRSVTLQDVGRNLSITIFLEEEQAKYVGDAMRGVIRHKP